MRKGEIIISMALFTYTCCEAVVTRLHDFVLNIFLVGGAFHFVCISKMLSFPSLCKMSCTHCWQFEKFSERQERKRETKRQRRIGIQRWSRVLYQREREREECCNIELYLLIFRLYSNLNFPVKQIILCVRISVIYETKQTRSTAAQNPQIILWLFQRRKEKINFFLLSMSKNEKISTKNSIVRQS